MINKNGSLEMRYLFVKYQTRHQTHIVVPVRIVLIKLLAFVDNQNIGICCLTQGTDCVQ